MKTNLKRLSIFLLACILTSCISGSPKTNANSQVQTSPTNQASSSETQNSSESIAFSVHPTINVYMETSGSMNGYVDQGKSQFQQVIFDYLSNIQNCGEFSGMNLNYITDKVTSKGCDVDSFVNTLTSTGIMNANGSKATTDIAALIDEILKNTSGEQVSIFISDCIFSPGSVSNPEAYLENQKIAIRNAVKSYIDRTGFAGCTVYRFTSRFKGSYFDYRNCAKRIDIQRPFYIWVFGSPVHLATIKSNVPDEQFMGAKVENTWTIINGDFSQFEGLNDYGLLPPSPTNGDYKWKSKTEVSSIKKSGDYFEFTFGVDLKLQTLLYGEEYAIDLDNYCNLINKTTGEEFLGSVRKDNIKISKYTHDITVKSDKPFSKGDICIAFDGKIPQWIYDYTDTDDSILDESNNQKTYGFNYMCEGIYAGFHANNSNNITASYNFVIK